MPRGIPKEKIYYVVEAGIPIPPRFPSAKVQPLPLDEMRVGDSFLIPATADVVGVKKRMFNFIIKMKELNGIEIVYSERKYPDGTKRIWRIK